MARVSRRRRFYVESGLGAVTCLLTIITVINREWIETAFGVDPDRGNGSAEWFAVAALAVATLVLGLLARSEYRRRLGFSGVETAEPARSGRPG